MVSISFKRPCFNSFPLQPELFRFTEGAFATKLQALVPRADPFLVNDNDELASRASVLLVKMCGVTPPRSLIDPILDAMFEAIQQSPVCRIVLILRTVQ
jgi:proteasome activator subunit 4